MPTSAEEGKEWSINKILKTNPETILDIGPGAGTYASLLRGKGTVEFIDGVEIWEPYVDLFGLEELYDEIFIGDFLKFEVCTYYDWVILGDVIEHFNKEDAYTAYQKARELGKYVLVSTPVIPYPQGPHEGNPYEEHRSSFTYEELCSLPGVYASWRGQILGVIAAHGRDVDEQ